MLSVEQTQAQFEPGKVGSPDTTADGNDMYSGLVQVYLGSDDARNVSIINAAIAMNLNCSILMIKYMEY